MDQEIFVDTFALIAFASGFCAGIIVVIAYYDVIKDKEKEHDVEDTTFLHSDQIKQLNRLETELACLILLSQHNDASQKWFEHLAQYGLASYSELRVRIHQIQRLLAQPRNARLIELRNTILRNR